MKQQKKNHMEIIKMVFACFEDPAGTSSEQPSLNSTLTMLIGKVGLHGLLTSLLASAILILYNLYYCTTSPLQLL